jgi:hypothetical protein
MDFLVLFEGDEQLWLPYSLDLASAEPFKKYVLSCPELEPLTMSAADWKSKRSSCNAQGVVGVVPGLVCYVNLKSWGDGYYRSLDLPAGWRFVVQCSYMDWTSSRKLKIDVHCPLFNQTFAWNAVAVRLHGMCLELKPEMILVDAKFCETYPKILG